jgi:hypothetical protein
MVTALPTVVQYVIWPDIRKELDVPILIMVSEHLIAHDVRQLKNTVACVEFLSANLEGRAKGTDKRLMLSLSSTEHRALLKSLSL